MTYFDPALFLEQELQEEHHYELAGHQQCDLPGGLRLDQHPIS
eukprot:CAMPEP_0116941600 /NCGR_PEP_ID=MMETSP0467-20121206/34083_1 /TAXON_ID=283647 /ORGANISM="Mesodinium pulex, Strain SPMC105" /LENGTH=42 /DNA_ID= /DNA_START= /DNA_END= /DNA_ORIENTATION=